MLDALAVVALILAGYLLGSLPMGVLVARAVGGQDPRTFGSGSTGATNTRRALGRRWAIVVAILDGAKGAAPILLARALDADIAAQALAATAAVVGAWRSVFIGFRGGRGVSTYFAGLLLVAPVLVLLAVPVFGVAITRTRLVSVGSLLGTATVVVGALAMVVGGALSATWLLFVLPGGFVVGLAHRHNIERLLAGTERTLAGKSGDF